MVSKYIYLALLFMNIFVNICCTFILKPQTLQLDFLMKILPNYHHLKKAVKGGTTPVRN